MANVWKCVNLSGLVFYINHLRQAVNETVFPPLLFFTAVMAATLKMRAPVRKFPSLCLLVRAEIVAPTEGKINTGGLVE